MDVMLIKDPHDVVGPAVDQVPVDAKVIPLRERYVTPRTREAAQVVDLSIANLHD